MIPYSQETLLSFALRLRASALAQRLGVRTVDLFPVLGPDRELKWWWHRDLGMVSE